MRKFPSLSLLHAFERAAYHRSFKLAAEDLFVTPSAVSHKIKQLEEELGVPLFHRRTRAIELTSAGRAYYRHVHRAFARLEQGSRELRESFGAQTLRIYVLPFFASEVLVTRLHSFQQRYPEVTLHMQSAFGRAEVLPEDVDLSITLGRGEWPGLVAERLMDISLLPVCAKSIAEKLDPERPESINDHVIIHYESKLDAWETWAKAVNLKAFDPRGQLTVDSVFSALQAVEQELGICQAALPICQARISQSHFETPFTEPVSTEESYYLVHRKADEVRPAVQQFREWLVAEMKKL